ncbi:hypothetical protein ABEW05_008999 [Botrytis cinerea]
MTPRSKRRWNLPLIIYIYEDLGFMTHIFRMLWFLSSRPLMCLHLARGEGVTVFTHSFECPATEQNRHNVRDAQGLLVNRRFGTLGIPCQHAWIREPHTGDHGQLVEKGVAVQAWPNTEPPIIFEAVDQDENARDNLRKQVRRINPVNMEEITWNVVKVEDEDGDEYDYEGGGGERT